MTDELGAKATQRKLADVRAANERREVELHAAGGCTDPMADRLRTNAFVEVLVEHLGLQDAFDLRYEEKRAELQEAVMAEARRKRLQGDRSRVAAARGHNGLVTP